MQLRNLAAPIDFHNWRSVLFHHSSSDCRQYRPAAAASSSAMAQQPYLHFKCTSVYKCTSRMMVVDAEQVPGRLAAGESVVAEDTGSLSMLQQQSPSLPPQAVEEKEKEKEEQKKQGNDSNVNNHDGLVDVYPLALEYLSPADIVRLIPICRSLAEAGRAVLPSVLAGELRPQLPRALVRMIDASPHRNEQWTKLAKEWRRKSFVRADEGGGEDADDDDNEGSLCKDDGEGGEELTDTPTANSSTTATTATATATTNTGGDDEESGSEEEKSEEEESEEDDDSTLASSSSVGSGPPSLYSEDTTEVEESGEDSDEDSDEDSNEDEDLNEDADDDEEEDGKAADTDTVLKAFLSKPQVMKCLVDGCDPAAFASWLLGRDECRGLADISHCLKGAYMAGTFEDETDEEGPYVTLTRSGLAENVGVLPEKYYDFAGLVVKSIEGPCEYYLCAEITGRGGQALYYPDGTPLIMWIDAGGCGVGPRKVSVVTRSEVNQGHIDEIRKFAPRCTCSECDSVIVPRITDYGGMNTTTLLMEEPHLAPQFLGCEKDSYGRMIIEEGYLDGLTFSRDEYPPGFGDGIFDNNGEDCEGCDLPSLSSLNELFEITLKAVSYHPQDGPSSVTVLHRAPLGITHALLKSGGEESGTVEYRFQAKQAGEVTAAVSMYNVSKLGSFLNEPFECDSRPTSNQLWINYWDIDLFSVKAGGLNGNHMSRSDLLWKCGMLCGL